MAGDMGAEGMAALKSDSGRYWMLQPSCSVGQQQHGSLLLKTNIYSHGSLFLTIYILITYILSTFLPHYAALVLMLAHY